MDIRELTFGSRDEFQRKKIAEQTIALLQSGIDVSPMVIDGSWGTGKTEFCHKLMNLMREQDSHQIVYIDAFKADHANEPLMSVLAEIIKLIPDEDGKKGFKDKALPVLRFGAKAVGKAVVSHLLRQDTADVVEEFDEAIQKTADKAIDATVESVLKDHVEAEQNLKALQDTLEELAAPKPIVLFVDELDRCRPDFAVDMLEIIKHTFDVPSVQFVLVTNSTQLKNSIDHCYGSNVGAQKYLDKFIKFRVVLPALLPTRGTRHIRVAAKHFENLVAKSDVLQESKLHREIYVAFVGDLVAQHSLSLREVETFVRYIEICHILSNKQTFHGQRNMGRTLLAMLAVALTCFKPHVAEELLISGISIEALTESLGVSSLPKHDATMFNPQPAEVLATTLALESPKTSSPFIAASEDEMARWKQRIEGYFREGGDWLLEEGQGLQIIAETIRLMGLDTAR